MTKTFLIVELGLRLDRFAMLHNGATLLLSEMCLFVMMATTSTVKLYVFQNLSKLRSILP